MILSRILKSFPMRKLGTPLLAVAIGAAALASSACNVPADHRERFTEGKVFAGGVEVTAKLLNDGHDSYMLYCYACHGENGDGKGPAAFSLRPPPRDFTKGIFKFARLSAGEDLPTDEDLQRIISKGLHGTAMLRWDIEPRVLDGIIQYIKTFAPQKWEKKKKNGDPVKTIEPFVPSEDPWVGKDAQAIQLGKELYHLKAECSTCHPSFGSKNELYDMSVAANKRDPGMFKVITDFRSDPFGSVAKDSKEYAVCWNMEPPGPVGEAAEEGEGKHGEEKAEKKPEKAVDCPPVKILPPDFTYQTVRSIHPVCSAAHANVDELHRPETCVEKSEDQLTDIYRVISYGVFPIMPKWRGAGLSESDIWAISHYVQSLIALRATPEAAALKTKCNASMGFQVPAPAPKEGEAAAAAEAASGDKAEKKAEKAEKKDEKAAEKK